MKVLFITNVPSPYRVDFFNELGKYCDLTVIFQKKRSKERKKYWDGFKIQNFKYFFIGGINTSTDSSFSFKIYKLIKQHKDHEIIVDGISPVANIAAIFYMKRHKIPYYLEIDGGKPNPESKKIRDKLKDRFKKRICNDAKGYFSSGKNADEYFIRYGANPNKIHRYPFTSLFEKDLSLIPLPEQEKNALKEEVGLKEKRCIVTVGRFTYQNGYGKGFDIFCELAKREKEKDIGFYIIGDEPTKEFLEIKNKNELTHLHFLPFFKKEELFKFYKACDLTMILSRGDVWGLVVNESLANGIPVISSDLCLAGTELIENEKNGFVVSLDDVNEILNTTEKMLSMPNSYYWNNCIESIKNYTIEKMAETHLKVLGGTENENLD